MEAVTMGTRARIALLCLLLGTSLVAGQAGSRGEMSEEVRRGLQRVVEMFESPERQEWQKPERVGLISNAGLAVAAGDDAVAVAVGAAEGLG